MPETDKLVPIDKIETIGKFSNDFSVGYMLHNVKKARTKPRTGTYRQLREQHATQTKIIRRIPNKFVGWAIFSSSMHFFPALVTILFPQIQVFVGFVFSTISKPDSWPFDLNIVPTEVACIFT